MVFQPLFQKASLAMVNAGLTAQRARDYSSLFTGQLGRLVFSLIYFITLAKALSLENFGVFATTSAIGIVLSRVMGFGFISPLYRIATVRPRLIGVYTTGYLAAAAVSLPLVLLIAWSLHALLYTGLITLAAFLAVILAEVVCWRTLEMTIIVNHGINRFLVGSSLAIAGGAMKAAAALWAYSQDIADLETWALLYLCSNAVVAVVALMFFYPRMRLRWAPKAWAGRARDAIGVSAAEVLFYIQAEMDKVLVLALGGEMTAGLYAIIMRIVDLTAMPLRAFSTMMIQWIMHARNEGKDTNIGWKVELLVAATSTVALLAGVVLLSLAPDLMGKNITTATSFLALFLLVPAFRNIIEYHTELLYAHERMAPRVWLLAGLGILKGALLALLLGLTSDFATMALWLNAVFFVLYGVSAYVTYRKVLGAPAGPQAVSNRRNTSGSVPVND